MHGYPKITSGVAVWEFLGMQMGNLEIGFALVFWAFMAALAEFGGGILLITGLLIRPAAFGMLFTMLIAALMPLAMGEGIKGSAHAIELWIVFLAMFAGDGKYSLDVILGKRFCNGKALS